MKETNLDIRKLDDKWKAKMDALTKKHSETLGKQITNKDERETIPILAKYHAKIELLEEKLEITQQEQKTETDKKRKNELGELIWDLETEIEAKKEFLTFFNKRLLLNF